MTKTSKADDAYSEEETVARREAALKTLLSTPHKAHKDSKKGSRAIKLGRAEARPSRSRKEIEDEES